jgi:hypothetical protein
MTTRSTIKIRSGWKAKGHGPCHAAEHEARCPDLHDQDDALGGRLHRVAAHGADFFRLSFRRMIDQPIRRRVGIEQTDQPLVSGVGRSDPLANGLPGCRDRFLIPLGVLPLIRFG